MRVAITTVLLLSLISLEADGQQANSTFKITQPAPKMMDDSSNEARYFAHLNNQPNSATGNPQNAAVNSSTPRVIRTTQIGNHTNSIPPVQQAVPRVQEQLPTAMEPMTHYNPQRSSSGTPSPTPMPQNLGRIPNESPNSQTVIEFATLDDQHVMANQPLETPAQYLAPVQPPTMYTQSTPEFAPQPTTSYFGNSGVEVRNHTLFGVDRANCCDEWAGFCNCGGLKANAGHLGLTWARGDDPCERTQGCPSNQSSCQCGECGDCAPSQNGLFHKFNWKKQ